MVNCDGRFIIVGQNLNNSLLLMCFDTYENKTSFLNLIQHTPLFPKPYHMEN